MATLVHQPLFSQPRPPSERTLKVEQLLTRYPDISEKELAFLVGSFPYLPPVDLSLMLADNRLAEKLESFHRDHGHMLVAPRTWLLAALFSTAALAGAILWWVMSAAGGA
ncbi:hypothetical protein GON01_10490 [Sphingomonas sp. MAH-20]|uniref:Uncharacterized protein n=1 Tax=Sphingomonas horti TaxID=2682842 RepID=A0A6I4J2R2_9SPHN|nr:MULTISPECIES: hypothetical protein [Sphingomonas]MBA2919478.1 hypothetical protein [Sphingomonas sp. CGMCC 1.13658]MVO78358.1 hypothetical protein [Sphingomonas horti]